MQGKMKVAVMTGVGRSAFEEREIPRPKAGEVLVKLEYIGICGRTCTITRRAESATAGWSLPLCSGTRRAAPWWRPARA